MRKRITQLVLLDLAFLLIMTVSGGIGGAFGLAVHYCAYLLPFAIGMMIIRRDECPMQLSPIPRGMLRALALYAPTLLLIIGISSVISALLALFGKTNLTDVSGPIFVALLRHALLPAVLEELLFRYIPMRLLGARSPRAAVFVSSLLFALIHVNLFQIPYALFAGAVLACITIGTGSIVPAMLLHFVNNAISVFWMRSPTAAPLIIIAALAVLLVPSIGYIAWKRRNYLADLRRCFSGERVGFPPEMIVLTILCLSCAVFALR